MTTTPPPSPRKPRVFEPDDPSLERAAPMPEPPLSKPAAPAPKPGDITVSLPTRADLDRGWKWGSILLSAMVSLATIAAGIWFTRFVSVALAREDWIGWVATALFGVIGVALLVLVGREIVGLVRLGRLSRIRRTADELVRKPNTRAERALIRDLAELAGRRRENAWAIARLGEQQQDVMDAGARLALADRTLLAPLDMEARRLIYASAKRIATVTAISPMMFISVGFVLVENVRLVRAVATLYGGRPGLMGSLKLFRMVVTHIIATGGIAMTDDLLGQFLGQDLLRRVSARLGEGAFNALLTARLGAAAVDVIRPLPFIEATPLRARDIVAELFRRQPADPQPPEQR